MSELLLYHFETTNAGGVVDTDKAVISGVSMITGDVTAKGHDLEVDDTTLKQLQACAKAKGKVPVKTNHGSGVDSVNGFLDNFSIANGKLRGDWHLLKAYPQTAQLLEMADRMPESVGLSVAFHGTPELADGRKVLAELDDKGGVAFYYTLDAKGAKVPLKKGEKKFARCSELVSTDLVASPAANPDGMFATRVDKPGEGMAKPSTSTPAAQAENAAEPTLADLMKAIQGLSGRIEAIESGAHGDDDGNEVEMSQEEIEEGLAQGWLKEDADGNLTMVGEPADDDGADYDQGEHQQDDGAGQEAPTEQAAEAALARGDMPTYFYIKNQLLDARMTRFEQAQAAKEQAEVKAAEREALTSFGAKLDVLTTEFETAKHELAAKNQLIAELQLKQPRLRTNGNGHLFGNPNAEPTTFEGLVDKKHAEMLTTHPQMKEFSRKAAAVEAVQKSHPDLYRASLAKKGVIQG